ncbi:hypothetical protein PhCBS80983_g03376 [Powellomyces hirtus]|uniref:E3 ubiquitin-protein ligase RNF220 middle domain-containing protein n=1 Tax=Powellomyces hirtus TaxID=109895 RepID=A0A507E2L5_9FUNG|nr:hypothetical protein PhCBS80983_g03376 [Powellomyces hirtus]
MQAHYEWELSRVGDDLVADAAEEGGKVRRGAAKAAAQQIASSHKGKGPAPSAVNQLDENELLLYRIKASQLKRAALNPNKPGSHKKRRGGSSEESMITICDNISFFGTSTYMESIAGLDLDTSICFMCNASLPTEAEDVNRHIDECLATQASIVEDLRESNDPEAWEEYSWAGQTRVRASAMLEGGYAASGFTVRKKTDEDTDEEIDIDDDDTEEFGEQQYNEDQLAQFRTANGDDNETPIESSPAQIPEITNTYSSSGGDTKLIVESLKSRIRDLESSAKSSPKCLICLDPYKIPLVSVICWHVHCEQ